MPVSLDDGREQLCLVVEKLVDRSLRNPGSGGDDRGGRSGETLFDESLVRCFHDSATALIIADASGSPTPGRLVRVVVHFPLLNGRWQIDKGISRESRYLFSTIYRKLTVLKSAALQMQRPV